IFGVAARAGEDKALPRYSAVWNPSNRTHDLLVKNVSESDLGLYYCALHEKKITKELGGVILSEDVYHYGNRTTRLSLLGKIAGSDPLVLFTSSTLQTPSTLPVSDCTVCYRLLVSVCLVCVLLASTCVIWICKCAAKGSRERREPLTVLQTPLFLVLIPPPPSRPPPPLLYQTVVSAGSCWSVCVQGVFSSAQSCPPPVFTGSAERGQKVLEREEDHSLTVCYRIELTWTNQTKTQTSASKTLTIIPHPAPVSEMERSRAVLLTLVCVLFSRISGAEVEMRVRPGDNVVLYCDCVVRARTFIVWFRKSSDEDQTPLIISADKFIQPAFSRHHFIENPSISTQDLLVTNVSESDLGLYYCALWERMSVNGVQRNVYHNGTRTTRLSLL
ncbi:hypothetical protein NFI96_016642, partial [Prochilodus magdalenae]